MNFILRISITFLLTHLCFLSFAQGYESPEPKMTKNVLKKFLNTQFVYPENALKNKEQGVVLIGFTIDEDGKIENRKIISSVSKEVDAAALDLFDLILWKPAYNYGKPIRGEGEFKIKYNAGKNANAGSKLSANLTYP